MGMIFNLFRLVVVALTASAILAGCGKDSPQALTASSKAFIAKGDYKAAVIQLRSALQQQPDYGEARYLLGTSLLEEGGHANAEKELRKALDLGYAPDLVYPALAKAMLRVGGAKDLVKEMAGKELGNPAAMADLKSTLALAYIGLGQRDDARSAVAAALKAQPGYAQARVAEAILAAMGNDLPTANRIVDEVLAQSPKLPDALSLKADLLLAQNDTAGGITLLKQVIESQPNNVQAHFNLASQLIQGQKYDEAQSAINAMKRAVPGDVRSSYLQALLAYRQGDAAKTRDAALQVLKVAPDHVPSIFLAGVADYRLGTFESAEDRFRKVLSRAPRSVEARSLLVATLLRMGKPERAKEALDPALKEGSKDPRLLRLAGEVAIANNDLAGAAQYYEQVSALDKGNATVRTRLGQVRLATGNVDQALSDLESASELDANLYQSDLALISAFLQRRELDKALEAAVVLEKKQPKNPMTYNVKGIIYLAKRDAKAARTNFEQALALKPDYLPAVRNLSGLDVVEKNPKAAKARYEALIVADPKNDGAMIGLAEILALTGAPATEVQATLERAVKANPASKSASITLINYQLRTGNNKAALDAAESASAANPDDVRLLDLLGLAQQANGAANQSIATFTKLARLRPDSPEPLFRLAAVHLASKNYDAAIGALRKAIALKPDQVNIRAELAMVQVAAGRSEAALAEMRAIQKDFPASAVGFSLQGDLHLSRKEYSAASSAYRQALKRQSSGPTTARLHASLSNEGKTSEATSLVAGWLKSNPNDVVLRTYLGDRSLAQKDYKGAMKYYQEVIGLQPQNAVVLNNLAWVADQLKDPAAIGYAERAFAAAPANPAIKDTYGWILYKKGDLKRSVELLTEAASTASKSVEIRLHLANALVASGDKAGARRELEAIVQMGPAPPQRAEAEDLLKKL